MKVEVIVPENFVGDIIADINYRKGKIESIHPKINFHTIKTVVPLSKMFGYSTALRSATQGKGVFSMHFSRFDKV